MPGSRSTGPCPLPSLIPPPAPPTPRSYLWGYGLHPGESSEVAPGSVCGRKAQARIWLRKC